ncbi:MAG: SAM-dependent methyltransferase [Cyanothece sp. SIO1E1]|nr:SAM-dependent methyltransferase [Cyanothece sp. SIO1E1]
MNPISLPVQNVSDTAFLTALYRALESDRPDALFHDPYARKLAGVRGEQVFRQMPYPEKLAPGAIVRTCVLDELILRSVEQNGVEAVLNLGAGLDTRAYRLPLPKSLLWVEADMLNIIDYKTRILADHQPICTLQSVALDVTNAAARQDVLQHIGTHATQILVVTEGLIVYMQSEQVITLARDLWVQPQVVGWLTDLVSPLWLKVMGKVVNTSEQATHTAQFQFAPEDGGNFFRELGWDTVEFRSVLEDGQQLQRLELPEPLLALWSSPEHREVLRQMCSVVLMQRLASKCKHS